MEADIGLMSPSRILLLVLLGRARAAGPAAEAEAAAGRGGTAVSVLPCRPSLLVTGKSRRRMGSSDPGMGMAPEWTAPGLPGPAAAPAAGALAPIGREEEDGGHGRGGVPLPPLLSALSSSSSPLAAPSS